MARKHWIWITIIIAVLHGLLTIFLEPISWDILFSRFEGNPYASPLDPVWMGLYFLLHLPYFVLSYLAGPLKQLIPQIFYLFWVANSLIWGLLGAWLVSILPFMKEKKEEIAEINDTELTV